MEIAKVSEFVGRKIIDASGNEFEIKNVKKTSVETDKNHSVIERVSVSTICGRKFNFSQEDLLRALA